MKQNIFLTTTLPYLSGNAHLGHSWEFVLYDFLYKYLSWRGHVVFGNIGVDEHGLKIQKLAESVNKTPKEFCDDSVEHWYTFLEKLNIKYDNFYRTSDDNHHKNVQ